LAQGDTARGRRRGAARIESAILVGGYLETVVEPDTTAVNVIGIGFFTTSTEGWKLRPIMEES
jgi:hypothetical protein